MTMYHDILHYHLASHCHMAILRSFHLSPPSSSTTLRTLRPRNGDRSKQMGKARGLRHHVLVSFGKWSQSNRMFERRRPDSEKKRGKKSSTVKCTPLEHWQSWGWKCGKFQEEIPPSTGKQDISPLWSIRCNMVPFKDVRFLSKKHSWYFCLKVAPFQKK